MKQLIRASLVVMITALLAYFAVAQATPTPNISFSGQIASQDGTLLVVNGLRVQTSTATVTGTLAVGVQVAISGVLQSDGVVNAITVSVVS